jgi:hypothetical protein
MVGGSSYAKRVEVFLMGLASGRVLTIERAKRGFRLHLESGASARMFVRRRERRPTEREFRRRGLVIVDEWGARIDESQFAKEGDPRFNRKSDPEYLSWWEFYLPMFLLKRRESRHVRQSSDDA